MWAYVMAADGLTSASRASVFDGGTDNPGAAITNMSSSGTGVTRQGTTFCPGDGSPIGKVYNFQDRQQNQGYGNDASPAAYNPESNVEYNGNGNFAAIDAKGVENCHNAGYVAYWYTTGSDADDHPRFNFRVNINTNMAASNPTNTFCVRMNVSVGGYPVAGDDLFPAANNVVDGVPKGESDQNHVANHLAKQGDIRCYKLHRVPPVSTNISYECPRININVPGAGNKHYKLFKYGVTNENELARGRLSGGAAHPPIDGAALFGHGDSNVPTIVRVYDDVNGGDYSGPVTDYTYSDSLQCVFYQPDFGRGMDCGGVYFSGVVDPDTPTGITISADIYDASGTRVTFPNTVVNYGDSFRFEIPGNAMDHTNYRAEMYAWDGSSDPRHYTIQIGNCKQPGDVYCSIKVLGNIGGTDGQIEAGADFTAEVTLSIPGNSQTVVDGNNDANLNLSLGGNQELPDGSNTPVSYDLWNPLATVNGDQPAASDSTGSRIRIGRYIGPGGSATVTFRAHAPSGIQNIKEMHIRGVRDGSYWFGQACQTTPSTFKHYTLIPQPNLGTNVEDPTTLTYSGSIDDQTDAHNDGGHVAADFGGVPADVTVSLYKKTPFTSLDTPKTDHDRFKDKSYGPYTVNNTTTYKAGDQYCTDVTIDHSTGWIGPGDAFVGNVGATNSSCPHVTNEPFFHVNNSSISACSPDGSSGLLAGYYNNVNSGSYGFGSSSQLSVTAMKEIVGVASDQISYSNKPTKLSFANTGGISAADSYSPHLGGNFGNGSCRTTVQVPGSNNPYPGSINSGMDGAYIAGNDVNVNGTIGVGHNVSVFAGGDVFINGNITYDSPNANGAWTKGHVPSFVLNAKGDIYIGPNVNNLDGLYFSEKTGGHIYTCSNSLRNNVQQGSGTNFYDICNKQLTVHGSFIADHVNLMRSYGTMRDEKPATNVNNIGVVPLYQLAANSGNGARKLQAGSAAASGYYYFDIQGYILPPNVTNVPNTVPLYEVGTSGQDMLYTTSHGEAQGAIDNYGYNGPIRTIGYVPNGPGPNVENLYRWNRGYHYYTINPGDTGGTSEGHTFVFTAPDNSPSGLSWQYAGHNYQTSLASGTPLCSGSKGGCLEINGQNCTVIDEPSDPIWSGSNGSHFDDNYVCLPATSTARLAWTYWKDSIYDMDTATASGSQYGTIGEASLDSLKAAGYTYCTRVNPPSEPSAHNWADNWLCSTEDLGLSASLSGPLDTSTHVCTPLLEPGDSGEGWGDAYLCEPKPSTTVTPPGGLNCSNSDAGNGNTNAYESFKRVLAGVTSGRTCAAEVFDFSPEEYLSKPAIKTDANGTLHYDAITSLPPVL